MPRRFKKLPDVCNNREMDIVRDLLTLGLAGTKTKHKLTESQLELVFMKVDRRISNAFFQRDILCKNAPVEALNLTECPVTNCYSLSVDGTPCGRHFAPLVLPMGKRDVSKMIETILRRYQKKLGRIKAKRKNTVRVDSVLYVEVINFIIKTCLSRHKLLASKYYAEMNDDLVDMAENMRLDSVQPLKYLLVQIGIEIGGILRGLENTHMKRFSKDAEGWAELFEDDINGKM